MINESLVSDELWIPAIGEQKPNKLIVTEKYLKKARDKYCQCIFCALKGEDRKNEELIEKVILDYVANYDIRPWSKSCDYIQPLDLLEILMKFVYNSSSLCNTFFYHPERNNLTPLMKVLLNNGFSQNEMDKILEKFTCRPQNEIDSDWDGLPF
jgi:hypothetical protein